MEGLAAGSGQLVGRGQLAGRWQLQEAKQRFSELIRAVEADGPQVVTRHGREVAVVIDIEDFRRLGGHGGVGFKAFLASAPDLDGLEIVRDDSPTRSVDLLAEP